VTFRGREVDPGRFSLRGTPARPPVSVRGIRKTKNGESWEISLGVDSSSHDGMLAVLLKPARGGESLPGVKMTLDGSEMKPGVESQKGMWSWYTLAAGPGDHTITFSVTGNEKGGPWTGKATAYFLCDQTRTAETVVVQMKEPPSARPMPPRPLAPGRFRSGTRLGEADLSSGSGG
jgi:hypothetical protein